MRCQRMSLGRAGLVLTLPRVPRVPVLAPLDALGVLPEKMVQQGAGVAEAVAAVGAAEDRVGEISHSWVRDRRVRRGDDSDAQHEDPGPRHPAVRRTAEAGDACHGGPSKEGAHTCAFSIFVLADFARPFRSTIALVSRA